MKNSYLLFVFILMSLIFFVQPENILAQSKLDCKSCHPDEGSSWMMSKHANTQKDIASELAANWMGQTPDSVISGTQAEDCVSCHSPVAITANNGMTETQVMAHFFSTTNGQYTSGTVAVDSANWPNVTCTSCHNVPSNHPQSLPQFGVFDSRTAQYGSVNTTSQVCGSCHGTLTHPTTDHQIYDAWKMSKHGHGAQNDLAGELAANHSGETPDHVISGEDCVACHSPSAVLLGSGMTEAQVLNKFFTTTGGTFTASTVPQDTLEWPEMGCNNCHDPHHPDTLSYFNSSTKSYQLMTSPDQLCGQCHGTLRFSGTDHKSYNMMSGTGGIGVANMQMMPGVKCVDCHMAFKNVDGTNSKMFKGHSWQVFVKEAGGTTTSACSNCHTNMSAGSAMSLVNSWHSEFMSMDSVAEAKVQAAATMMQGSKDTTKLKYLVEAQTNMTLAENDESGGIHNHVYSKALLQDAIDKANSIVTGITTKDTFTPFAFKLVQNYPNPFNPATTINFSIKDRGQVTLKIYDMLGREVATLINQIESPGNFSAKFDPSTIKGGLTSGVYIYQLRSNNLIQTKKMVYLK
ncbi:MAG: ammonia-forming cytochrome c nitrite reductase subunit c552 [Ignavibacteriaceae bacterium]